MPIPQCCWPSLWVYVTSTALVATALAAPFWLMTPSITDVQSSTGLWNLPCGEKEWTVEKCTALMSLGGLSATFALSGGVFYLTTLVVSCMRSTGDKNHSSQPTCSYGLLFALTAVSHLLTAAASLTTSVLFIVWLNLEVTRVGYSCWFLLAATLLFLFNSATMAHISRVQSKQRHYIDQ